MASSGAPAHTGQPPQWQCRTHRRAQPRPPRPSPLFAEEPPQQPRLQSVQCAAGRHQHDASTAARHAQQQQRRQRRPLPPQQQDSHSPPPLLVELRDGAALAEEADGSWGEYGARVLRSATGAALALAAEPDPQLVRAADKNRLKPALRAELARRLRREAPDAFLAPGSGGPLRVFRYALDDLRLYQALHQAGVEGRVVVVDDPDRAHLVLATRRTRTGRDMPTSDAKRVAERRGIPYVELERVSARRLMVALAPLMGVPVPPHLLEPSAPPQPRLRVPGPVATEAAALQQALPPGAAGRPRGGDGAAPAAARTVGELLGFGGAAQPARQGASGVDAGGRRAESRVQGSAAEAEGHPGLVAACVEEADVHDARRALLPPNPTERLGERHGIARPIKHGRRVRLKQELRKAAERDAAW